MMKFLVSCFLCVKLCFIDTCVDIMLDYYDTKVILVKNSMTHSIDLY